MSIWTSKAALCVFTLMLAGCVAPDVGLGTSRNAPILGGALTIGLPAGYCIDRNASREQNDTAVVIMGRCSDNAKALPALITISIGQSGSAGVMAAGGAELAAFFTSPAGKATLARDGNARDVRVIGAVTSGEAFLLHLQDKTTGEYWRAVIGKSGRLVTVSATGSPNAPLSAEDSRKVLDMALKALK